MLTKPENLKFEKPEDYIDYVARGFIPSKANFTNVKAAVADPNELLDKCMNVNSQQMLNICLDRIYEDRLRNRRITIGAFIGMLILGLFIGKAVNNSHKKDEDDSEMCDMSCLEKYYEVQRDEQFDI